MYSRILVAVDDSDISKLALQEAIKLAQDQKAKLSIIYVADLVITGEYYPLDIKDYQASVKKHAKSVLKRLLTTANTAYNKIEGHLIEMANPDDNIPEKIISEANKWRAELIVLGTHGRSGISRFLLGSITEEVIRNTSITVHVVREEAM